MTHMIPSPCSHLENYAMICVCSDEVVQSLTHGFLIPQTADELHVIRSPGISRCDIVPSHICSSRSCARDDGTSDGICTRCPFSPC